MALALPQAVEGSHMGRVDFRVRNKIFATLPPDGHSFNLKTTSVNLDALVVRDPATFRDVWAGRWVGVQLTGVREDEARDLLVDAWALVAPPSLRRETDPASHKKPISRARTPR